MLNLKQSEFVMNQSKIKRYLSGLALILAAFALSACQSAVGTAGDNAGASQKAGQSAGQNAEDVTPEVPEVIKVPETTVETTPVVPNTSQDGQVLDENGNVMGWMRNGEFVANPDYVAGAADLLSQTILYFDFDQSGVKDQYRDVLAAHAKYLASNPGLSLRLEGHADERGSREYNIGLGERRAQAVKRALLLNGVSAATLKTISFGEEKPRVQGSGETSWAENRRVELVYR